MQDYARISILHRELEPLISTAQYFSTKDNLIITLN